MTPDQAAALLGVATTASHKEVRAAFRRAAISNHPDANGDERGGDIDKLTAARDSLLAEPDPGPVAPPPQPSSPPAEAVEPQGSSRVGCFFVGIAGFVGFAFLAFALIALIGTLMTRDTPVSGPMPEAECIVIDDNTVHPKDCDEPGALRVASEVSGAQTCPAGHDSLVVNDRTWCLISAGPGN